MPTPLLVVALVWVLAIDVAVLCDREGSKLDTSPPAAASVGRAPVALSLPLAGWSSPTSYR